MGSRDRPPDTSSPVEVREYRSGDESGIRSLYRATWHHTATPAWFDWKYDENPFTPESTMYVAEIDGRIAGIRPVFDVPLLTEGRRVDGALFSNAMVHPDNRGDGVYSALMEMAHEAAADRGRDIGFAFANENSAPILAHWGWTDLGKIPKWYRVERPGVVLGTDGWSRWAGTIADGVATGYLRLRRAFATSDYQVTVERIPSIAPERLAVIARRSATPETHVERSAKFYSWRLASPLLETTTFVAVRGDDDLAAIVTRRQTIAGADAIQLFDLVPLSAGDGEYAAVEQQVIATLLDEIIETYPDVAMLTAPGTVWRRIVLGSRGFLSNESVLVPNSLETGFRFFVTPLSGSTEGFEDLSSWALAGTILETI